MTPDDEAAVPRVPPQAERTPPRDDEATALCDLSALPRHALKRCRDIEAGGQGSENLNGAPTMKRSGSLRDLGMAHHLSGVPMTKSGLSGCLDDMGLSGFGDRKELVLDLVTVPGSPATAPTGEESTMMPKIDSVLSLPSVSPSSHNDRVTDRAPLREETIAAQVRTQPEPNPVSVSPTRGLTRSRTLAPSLSLSPTPTPTLTLTLTLALALALTPTSTLRSR